MRKHMYRLVGAIAAGGVLVTVVATAADAASRLSRW